MYIEDILRSIGQYKGELTEWGKIRKLFLSPDSYKRIRRYQWTGQVEDKNDREKRERRNFANLVNYLVKQGFVEKQEKKGIKLLRLTKSGKERLGKSICHQYQAKPSDKTIIVIFDIPEKFKHKRNWLRQRLVEMDFKKVQNSVWMARVKLPSEFINDLRNLKMLSYVEIFSAQKIGTLV